MKIKLNLFERAIALKLLPDEGNFSTLRVIRETESILLPSADEIKKYNIHEKDGYTHWTKEGNEELDLEINDIAAEMIKSKLKKLDETNKLAHNQCSLYEKFMRDLK